MSIHVKIAHPQKPMVSTAFSASKPQNHLHHASKDREMGGAALNESRLLPQKKTDIKPGNSILIFPACVTKNSHSSLDVSGWTQLDALQLLVISNPGVACLDSDVTLRRILFATGATIRCAVFGL